MNIWSILKRLQLLEFRLRAVIYSINPYIKIGKGTKIERGVELNIKYGGSIEIGDNCYLSKGAQVITEGGGITIGNDCTINPYTIVYGQGNTIIGNGVRIAAHCVIVPSNHRFDNPSEFIYKQGLTKLGIIIEDDVWLGTGVKVLDGVTISKGCVIGANAVVTRSTEANGIYVGIPAKLIKNR